MGPGPEDGIIYGGRAPGPNDLNINMERKSRYAIGGYRAGQRYDRCFIDNGP